MQTDGTERAYRVTDSKAEATKIARRVAENKQTELVIKNADGRIGSKDSHGNDPRRIKG